MQFCHNDDESKGYGTYVDRLTPLGIPDGHGIYPTVVPDEQMKVSTGEIPPEILEYLEEITKDKQQSRINSMLWMGRSKMIARICAGIMFIMAVICIILSVTMQ